MLPEALFKEKLFAMYDECKKYQIPKTKYYMMISDLKMEGRKEGNVLFNDALNTFYLRLYGVTPFW